MQDVYSRITAPQIAKDPKRWLRKSVLKRFGGVNYKEEFNTNLLLECPECGREDIDFSYRCPNCGTYIKQKLID